MNHTSIASQSTLRGTTLNAYFASLIHSPKRAQLALLGCLIMMVLSPAGLSAMIPFVTASFAIATHRSQAEAILLFVAVPLLIGPLVLPIAGAWVDRWGARAVAVPAVILYAVASTLIPVVSGSLWLLVPMIVLAALFGFMSSLAIVFKIVTGWFPEHRGIGFALIGVVSSFAGAAFSPLFQWLINGSSARQNQFAATSQFSGMGWNGAYYVVAGAVALIGVPTAMFLLSEPDERTDGPTIPMSGPQLMPLNTPGVTLKTAVRSRTWLSIALFLAFAAAGPMTVRQNSVAFFGGRGFDLATIAISQSFLFIASIIGLLLGGMALDRSRSPWVIAPLLAMVPIGLIISYANHGSALLLFIAMISLGFATGAESALGPFLIARYFGPRSFAQIQGLTLAISTLFLGLSPFLTSAIASASGSYFVPFAVLTGLTILAVILAALLPAYPPEWSTELKI